MTIESALERIATALEELVAAKAIPAPPTNQKAAPATRQPVKEPEGQVIDDPTPAAIATKTGVDHRPKAAPAPLGVGEIPYDKVRAAVLGLASAKGDAAATAILAKFGVKSAKALPVGQYAELLDAISKA